MGQKVNPHGLRVGVIKDWDSKWYADSDFADFLVEDHKIREFLKKKLYSSGYEYLYEPFDLNGKGTKIAFVKDPDGYEIELIEKVIW